MAKPTLHEIHEKLVQFTDGADALCRNLTWQNISGTVFGTQLVEAPPKLFVQRMLSGRQAMTLVLNRGDKRFHINMLTLLELAKSGTDMPAELDPQFDTLMSVVGSEHWDPSVFNAYAIGEFLGVHNSNHLTVFDGLPQEYILVLCPMGSPDSVSLNVASLIAMARHAVLSEKEVTCADILAAVRADGESAGGDADVR